MNKNKTYLLYGKNTISIIIIEAILFLTLTICGIILGVMYNIIYLFAFILCACFFAFDLFKKLKYKLILTKEEIIVNNDELPQNKKIQYYINIKYKEIKDIFIEEKSIDSKGNNYYKVNKFLTFKCSSSIKRISINYLKEEELNSLRKLCFEHSKTFTIEAFYNTMRPLLKELLVDDKDIKDKTD